MDEVQTTFYVYILYSAHVDKYYVGHSHNPWLRFEFHNSQDKNAFTTKGRPWELKAVFEAGNDRSVAMGVEKFIKKQKNRRLIENLIDPAFEPEGRLAQLVIPHLRDAHAGLISRSLVPASPGHPGESRWGSDMKGCSFMGQPFVF